MYSFFKWVIITKKSVPKKGYFMLHIPNDLLKLLDTSQLTLIKDSPILEGKVNSHTRRISQVRTYSKSRKKSVNCKRVLAQSQILLKAPIATLKFPTIFRLKHICNVLLYLPIKTNEWVKFRYEGTKEIYPHDYGLIEKADINAIGERDRLITFD